MIDLFIALSSSFSVLVFVIILTFVVRKTKQRGIFMWLKRTFLGVWFVSSFFVWLIVRDLPLTNQIGLVFVHLLITWLLSFSYIVGFFGLPLTSVRIELLTVIGQKGEKGIRRETFMKKHNKTMFAKRSLYRLVTSGEIRKRGRVYSLRSAWSYVMLHTYVLVFLFALYRPMGSERKIV